MGGWDEKYTIKKNPFVEGLQNYRDFLHTRFRITSRNALPVFFVAVAFPAFIAWGDTVSKHHKAEKYAADFPDKVRRPVSQVRAEQREKKEREKREKEEEME
jgi:hypothetical protein